MLQTGSSPTLMVASYLGSGVVAWGKSPSWAAHQFGSAHVRAGSLTFTNTGRRAHGHSQRSVEQPYYLGFLNFFVQFYYFW